MFNPPHQPIFYGTQYLQIWTFFGFCAALIGLLAISIPSSSTLLSHLPFLLLFSIIYSDLELQCLLGLLKMQFAFLILYLLFGGDLKTVKSILYVFKFSNTKHTRSFHISVPLWIFFFYKVQFNPSSPRKALSKFSLIPFS